MTICTEHSYGGPQACPYCEIARLRVLRVLMLKRAQLLELDTVKLAHRLHVQRAVSRHWAEKAEWEGEYERQTLRDGREIVKLRLDVDILRMERDNAESEAEALKVKLAEALDRAGRML